MNETIAYFYTDRARADLKRSQIHSVNESSYMVVRSIDWAHSIEWSNVFLVIVDYDSDRHKQINDVLNKISRLDQPPIVVVDPLYKSDQDELYKASELDYFHCIREPINQNDLKRLIKSARSRFTQEKMAKHKWPVVLQKDTLVEIRDSLRSLNPGEINYVLGQLHSHNQIFIKFIQGVHKSKVESKHILKVAKFFQSNEELSQSMLDELKRRGDYFITSGRIRAEVLLSKSNTNDAGTAKTSHDEINQIFHKRQGDKHLARKLLAAKIKSGENLNLGLAMQKSFEPGTIDKERFLKGLADMASIFFNELNALKPSKVRHEFLVFYNRLNRRVSLLIQRELMVHYHSVISNQYYLNHNYYASRVHSELAHEIFIELNVESQKSVLVPIILMSIWRGDITNACSYIQFGEDTIEGFQIKGVSYSNQTRYQELKHLHHRVKTEPYTLSLLKTIQAKFPNSELESLALNKARKVKDSSNITELKTSSSIRLERRKQTLLAKHKHKKVPAKRAAFN